MLIGIDPLIGPELLMVLAQMGHGDTIVIADANFPAASVARGTVHRTALRIDCPARRAVEAVLSLMPVDDFEDAPVEVMQVVGDPSNLGEVVAEARPIFAAAGVGVITGRERFDFYDRARRAFAVLQTAEPRKYGNFIIRKGVL